MAHFSDKLRMCVQVCVCVVTKSSAWDRWDESHGLRIVCLLSDWMFSQVWIWVPLRGNTAAADGGLQVQQPVHWKWCAKVTLMCRRHSHKSCAGLYPSLLQRSVVLFFSVLMIGSDAFVNLLIKDVEPKRPGQALTVVMPFLQHS